MNDDTFPGLYVHVPFCLTKCPYCGFSSQTDLSLVPEWIKAIQKEALLYKDQFDAFDSLYLGGGTPSLLSEHHLTALTECLHGTFRFTPDIEFTLEANPDDLSPGRLSFYRSIGINRISLGVQSLDDRELAFLGRRHSARQAERALGWARECGLRNVGVDLMYGLPGQSPKAWIRTLQRAVDFSPEHLSCYQLTFEEGTPLKRMLVEGVITPTGEEAERAFFLLTSGLLEDKGYVHYEVSNFARGERSISRHNSKYWRHVPYLGMGPSAHSFQGGTRWWNTVSVRGYCEALEMGRSPVAGREALTEEQYHLEALSLGMRTRQGIALRLLERRPQAEKVLRQLRESGLVRLEAGRVVPTREGYLVADSLPLLLSA